MGRSRYKFVGKNQPHFMTCTVLEWLPVFTRPATINIVIESLRFLSKEGFVVHAYVILKDHLHLLARSERLDKDIARFKSYTATSLIKLFTEEENNTMLDRLAFHKKDHKADRSHQVWQEGVHPEWIQGDAMMREKIEYIHHNPVKRGYVDHPEQWQYSSAGDYLGRDGLLEIQKQW